MAESENILKPEIEVESESQEQKKEEIVKEPDSNINLEPPNEENENKPDDIVANPRLLCEENEAAVPSM